MNSVRAICNQPCSKPSTTNRHHRHSMPIPSSRHRHRRHRRRHRCRHTQLPSPPPAHSQPSARSTQHILPVIVFIASPCENFSGGCTCAGLREARPLPWQASSCGIVQPVTTMTTTMMNDVLTQRGSQPVHGRIAKIAVAPWRGLAAVARAPCSTEPFRGPAPHSFPRQGHVRA